MTIDIFATRSPSSRARGGGGGLPWRGSGLKVLLLEEAQGLGLVARLHPTERERLARRREKRREAVAELRKKKTKTKKELDDAPGWRTRNKAATAGARPTITVATVAAVADQQLLLGGSG